MLSGHHSHEAGGENALIMFATFGMEIVKCGALEPHQVQAIYYMTPTTPNCLVDVVDVWDLNERAMDQLGTQMAFTFAQLP